MRQTNIELATYNVYIKNNLTHKQKKTKLKDECHTNLVNESISDTHSNIINCISCLFYDFVCECSIEVE